MTECDNRTVIWETAQSLGFTEFELFAVSYRAWYYREAPRRELEHHYVSYMFYGVVPFWVRHFIRETRDEIRERNDAGSRPRGPRAERSLSIIPSLLDALVCPLPLLFGIHGVWQRCRRGSANFSA